MSNLAAFTPFTIEDADQASKDIESDSDFFKPGQGSNLVRFLPARAGEIPFVSAMQHFVKDLPGMTGAAVFNCPRHDPRNPRPCRVCADVERLLSSGSSADQKMAKKMAAKQRVYANVIVIGEEAKGPRVFAFGKQIWKQLLDIRKDTKGEGGDFTHPSEGFNLNVKRKGEDMATEYLVSRSVRPSEAFDMTWVDLQANLGKYGLYPADSDVEDRLVEANYPRIGRPTAASSGKRNVQSDVEDLPEGVSWRGRALLGLYCYTTDPQLPVRVSSSQLPGAAKTRCVWSRARE